MIMALEKTSDSSRRVLRSLLMQRREAGFAAPGQKELMLAIFEESGALNHTSKVLSTLWDQILAEIRMLEGRTEKTNMPLTHILCSLSPPKKSECIS